MAIDTVSVLSPEGVALELPVAGPGPRILAYAIDAVVITGLQLLAFLLLSLLLPLAEMLRPFLAPLAEAFEDDPTPRGDAYALLIPIFLLVILLNVIAEMLYFTFCEVVTSGRSLGKMILGLRVTSVGGLPIDFVSSLIRNLLRLVDTLPTSYAIGLITIVLSERRQRLGDHAAGTVVIRTDRTEPAPEIVLPPTVVPLPLSREQLGRLGGPELRLVRSTLRRIEDASDERTHALLTQTAAALRTRLGLEETGPGNDLKLLQRLLAAAEEQERASLG